MLMHAAAVSLRKKHKTAVKGLRDAKARLAAVEGAVRKRANGAQELVEWRTMEKQWLRDVVDLKQHHRLSNPYEPRAEKGESMDASGVAGP